MLQPLEFVTAGLAVFAFSRLGMPVTVTLAISEPVAALVH